MDQTKQARAAVLARQNDRLNAGLNILDRLDRRFFQARLVTLLLGAAATLFAFGLGPPGGALGWEVLAAVVLIFGTIVFFHRRMDRRRSYYTLFLRWTATQAARLRLDWPNIPAPFELHVDKAHPFASDLDLTGDHSLHQLIDMASARGGSQRLADWLLRPALDRAGIERRQVVLKELLGLNGFRTGLAMKGMQVRESTGGHWNGETLLRWLGQEGNPRSLLPVLVIFSLGLDWAPWSCTSYSPCS